MPYDDDEEDTNDEKVVFKKLIRTKQLLDVLAQFSLQRQQNLTLLNTQLHSESSVTAVLSELLRPKEVALTAAKPAEPVAFSMLNNLTLASKVYKGANELRAYLLESEKLIFEFQNHLHYATKGREAIHEELLAELQAARRRVCECLKDEDPQAELTCSCLQKATDFETQIKELIRDKQRADKLVWELRKEHDALYTENQITLFNLKATRNQPKESLLSPQTDLDHHTEMIAECLAEGNIKAAQSECYLDQIETGDEARIQELLLSMEGYKSIGEQRQTVSSIHNEIVAIN
jgi:hypothetical protein